MYSGIIVMLWWPWPGSLATGDVIRASIRYGGRLWELLVGKGRGVLSRDGKASVIYMFPPCSSSLPAYP